MKHRKFARVGGVPAMAITPRRSGGLTSLALALSLAGALAVQASPTQAAKPQADADWAKGRILVQPRPGLPDAELDRLLKPHGGKSMGRIQGTDVHVVQLPAQASEKAVAALLAHNPHFKFAELDMRVSGAATANDPYFSKAWHLSKIDASKAWDSSQGEGVVIAILDSGVDANHADLRDRLVPGWNVLGGNTDTSDVHGHGTAVAGAAVASTNNGVGVAAVAAGSLIMPVRIADANAYAYWSDVAKGVTWAADNGARVANISYNGVSGSSTVQSAARYMRDKGGLVVVAAGNSGGQEAIAANDSLITVSATDANDAKASWSSYGNYVDLAAPGVSIWTTTRGGGYQQWSGTSLASPVAAGVAGLMMAANPALGPADIETLLFATAVDLGAAGLDTYFGHGRVQAAAAVAAALNAEARDAQAPTVSITAPAANGTVKGLVTVDVAAVDNVGISRVDLVVNGSQLASDTSAPFGFSWDTTRIADGNAQLVAYAYDAAGNASSHAVTVKVSNTVDAVAPTVSISNPTDGAKVSSKLSITASSSDNVGVTRIQLYIDGKLKTSVNGSRLSYTWNTSKESAGKHSIEVRASDAAGNLGGRTIQVTK